MSSTPVEKEPVMECPLLLTALSGVTFKVSLSVAKFDRFTDLEDQVTDYLASVTDLKVLGCVIDFLHTTTQTYLEDPIWDKLQQGKEYTIVFRNCSVTLPEQEQLGGYSIDQVPLAVHVPMNPEEIVWNCQMECPSTMQGRTTICSCGRRRSTVRNASDRGCCSRRSSNSNSQPNTSKSETAGRKPRMSSSSSATSS